MQGASCSTGTVKEEMAGGLGKLGRETERTLQRGKEGRTEMENSAEVGEWN